MTRSGMETICRAVRYSGCFSKREEFSRVEASSGGGGQLIGAIWVRFNIIEAGAGELTLVGLLELGLRGKVRHDADRSIVCLEGNFSER